MHVVIGIDPGLKGAIAINHPVLNAGWHVDVYDMPTFKVTKSKEVLNLIALTAQFKGLQEDYGLEGALHVFIEDVHARPRQGVVSMFNFGKGCGQLEGLLTALGIPFELVAPQTWQKEMLEGYSKGKDQGKDVHRLVASRMWPRIAPQLDKKIHDGRADALLIAEYGRRKLLGEA